MSSLASYIFLFILTIYNLISFFSDANDEIFISCDGGQFQLNNWIFQN